MNAFIKLVTISLIAGLSFSAQAQVATTKVLTLDAAKKIAATARQFAVTAKAPGGSIAIVDAGGELIYLERLDNTFAASALIAYDKAHTSAMFKTPSRKLEESIVGGRTPLITVGYTMLIGGVPITLDGVVVGAIGVSGSASAQQDEEIALAGAKTTFNQ
ncbi:heme-binding protein [Nibrella viscosa]|uniref:Heme-binding protein n=1 Tax=Nibrella viscosa TaxID=1084524 RepID=A0ABP8KSW9_9BACT